MMHLGFSLTPFGHHPAAWRDSTGAGALDFDALLEQVALAEKAIFDFVLLSDRLGKRPTDVLSSVAAPFEPTTLVSALSTRARRIGFLAAAATRQHEPYNLARRFASLESISGGRTGWTIVGTPDKAGRDREYVDVVSALWDSWEDDAFIYDKASGRFFVPDKMHVLNHSGTHFSVRGPLNVNRSPQGKAVLSYVLTEQSRVLAAHSGEFVFLQSDSPTTCEEDVAEFTRSLEREGRQRSAVRISANIVPFVAATRQQAQALRDSLQEGIEDSVAPILNGAVLIGTPADIADALEQWFEAGHVDGFTILPPTAQVFRLFATEVVPELQRRELVHSNYVGSTLRDHLGLPRPYHPIKGVEHAS